MKALRLLLLSLPLMLGACSTTSVLGPKPGDDQAYAPVQPIPPQSRQEFNGSIFQTGTGMSLFTDNKARHVGDVITVLLVEKTNAKKQADTDTSKESSLSLPTPTLANIPVTRFTNSLDSKNSFKGKGASTQSNELKGYITVTVAEVLPNGNLVVQGEKWLQLNQGREYIRLRGVVRPADVQPDNTVESTKVADARISYGGTGALADANEQGWMGRFFNSPIWPF